MKLSVTISIFEQHIYKYTDLFLIYINKYYTSARLHQFGYIISIITYLISVHKHCFMNSAVFLMIVFSCTRNENQGYS